MREVLHGGGGLDRESAEGEAAGRGRRTNAEDHVHDRQVADHAALGQYRDRKGAAFRLGAFHDDLLRNGSLPLSVVEWLLLDDSTTLDAVLK